MNGRHHLRLKRISLTSPRPVLMLSVAALGILPISSAVLNYDSQDLSDDQRAYQYIRDVKGSVPDGSVVLSDEEITAFSLWYIRYVEDSEWDVAPIVVPLLQFDWYRRNIQSRFRDRLPAEVPSDLDQIVKSIVDHNTGSSRVFFTY